MHRTSLAAFGLGATLALATSCSKDESKRTPTAPPVSSMPATVSVVTCAYAVVASDSLQIDVPAMPACDTLSSAPVFTADTSTRPYYSLSATQLQVGLSKLAPLIRVMTAGPSFSSDIGATLTTLDSMEQQFGVSVLGVLTRAGADDGSGLDGLWKFAGLGPSIVDYIVRSDTSSIGQAMRSLLADSLGRPVLFFRFEGQTLTGLVSRSVYGKGAIANMVDTAAYAVSTVTRSDSTWNLVGRVRGDTIGVAVDSAGNIAYHYEGAAADSAYIYHLWPQTCPDALTPTWFSVVLAANPR